MLLTDLCPDILIMICERAETSDLCPLRESCKALQAAVYREWIARFIRNRYVSVGDRRSLLNVKRITSTKHLVDKIERMEFGLGGHIGKAANVSTAAAQNQSIEDSQDWAIAAFLHQHYEEHYQQPLDQALVTSILGDLKSNDGTQVGFGLVTDHRLPLDDDGVDWSVKWPNASDRAHEMLNIVQCSAWSPHKLYIADDCNFRESELVLAGLHDVRVLTKDLKILQYLNNPHWDGSAVDAITARSADLKVLQSANGLEELNLFAFHIGQFPGTADERLAYGTAIVTANTATHLRILRILNLHCHVSDLIKILDRCQPTLHTVELTNLAVQRGRGSWSDILRHLKRCSGLADVSLSGFVLDEQLDHYLPVHFRENIELLKGDTVEEVRELLDSSLEYWGSSDA